MSSHPALEKFVARRSALNHEERGALLRLPVKIRQFGPRSDIVSTGDTVSHACLVARGLVAGYDQILGGKRQVTALHLAGDMCDLHSLIAPVAVCGMTALPATTVLLVAHSDLAGICLEFPQVARSFWRDGVADAAILAKWLVNVARMDARARLAHLLCELGTRSEIAGLQSRTCFNFPATQEQMADALGMTAVHVNRTLQSLRCEGVVDIRSQRVEVHDWNKLAAIGEFDCAYLLLNEPRDRHFAVAGRPGIATAHMVQ